MTDQAPLQELTRADMLAILTEKLDQHFELLKQSFPTRAEMEAFINDRLAETLIMYPTRPELIERLDEQTIPILNQLSRLQDALKRDVEARNGEIVVRAEQSKRLDAAINAINTLTTRFETHEENRAIERRETVERLDREDERNKQNVTALAATVQQLKVTIHGDNTVRDDQPSIFGEINLLRAELRNDIASLKANQQTRLADDQHIKDYFKRKAEQEAQVAERQKAWNERWMRFRGAFVSISVKYIGTEVLKWLAIIFGGGSLITAAAALLAELQKLLGGS